MISSMILKKDSSEIVFNKIELDVVSKQIKIQEVKYELKGEMLKHVENKHRIFLPCKIKTDEDLELRALSATLYVPITWNDESIENYIQALSDELFLYQHNITGCKYIKKIENDFMLEIIVL